MGSKYLLSWLMEKISVQASLRDKDSDDGQHTIKLNALVMELLKDVCQGNICIIVICAIPRDAAVCPCHPDLFQGLRTTIGDIDRDGRESFSILVEGKDLTVILNIYSQCR